MLENVFEWQKPLWRQLFADTGNMPHAMLMAGPEGLGKLAFAQALAARLLCEQRNMADGADGTACGHCSSCTWLASGNHPDFRLILPDQGEDAGEEGDEASQAASSARKPGAGPIRVDQIRALADFVFVGSHRLGSRVAIIAPAEAMNPAAANALLKVLEEPPPDVYFILISSNWRRLIPTIRSRCRSVIFGRPDSLMAEQWLTAKGVKSAAELLRLTGGAPLLAADWAEQGRLESCKKAIEALSEKPGDPIAIAAQWSGLLKGGQEFGLQQLVETIQKWVYDLVLLKIAGRLQYHHDWRSKLEPLAARASHTGLLTCYADLLRIRSVVRHPLNAQLFLEDMATRYLRGLAAGRA
ncbi:MAG: DNA polymerase III subunit delta' [Betaproteobacteria bacterium]|nr:DNA polymerase III subunit delta' [Betaproteobacteria bacterium]